MSLKKEKVIVDGVEHEVVNLKSKEDDIDPRDNMIKNLIEKIGELNKKIEDIESKVRYHDNWIKSEIELRNFRDGRATSLYELD